MKLIKKKKKEQQARVKKQATGTTETGWKAVFTMHGVCLHRHVNSGCHLLDRKPLEKVTLQIQTLTDRFWPAGVISCPPQTEAHAPQHACRARGESLMLCSGKPGGKLFL